MTMNVCMRLRIGVFGLVALALLAGAALAQVQQYAPGNVEPRNSAAAAEGAIQPNLSSLQFGAPQQSPMPQQAAQQTTQQAVQQPPPPPFTLTPQQQADVDRVLEQWEKRNESIKTFDCCFKRWSYDAVFANSNKPNEARAVELGILKYKAPDCGLFRVEAAESNGKVEPIADGLAEHWVCDGKSIFEFKHDQKRLVEHPLPPDLRGKAIADTPLPFLFGSEAHKLKQRYWIRVVEGTSDQIWLEAYPRFQKEAANFSRAEFIISKKDMVPVGLKLIDPNQKAHKSYMFYKVVVNDPLQLFHVSNPFRPVTPFGWKWIKEQPSAPQGQPQAQAGQPAAQRR
jgi:TIGR03009 family protein